MSITSPGYTSLRAAARYARAFCGKTFVFKLGGNVLDDGAALKAVCEQLNVLWSFSIRLVIVHGGGTRVDALCDALKLPVRKVDGRRITTPEALDAVKMGLGGSVRMDLIAAFRAAGLPAVGVSGGDAGLVRVRRRPPVAATSGAGDAGTVDYGCVGDVKQVEPGLLEHLLAGGYVPLVTPLCVDTEGCVLNVNADTVAAELAVALQAEKLLFLLGVPGLLESVSDLTSLIPYATLTELDALEERGGITAGMHPKLAAVRRALAGGVTSAHLVSGVMPDAVLAEVFTNQGSGTMVTMQDETAEGCAA